MIRPILSSYRPSYLKTLVYMAQSTEYNVREYVAWFWRVTDFSAVMYRRILELTTIAKLLFAYLIVGTAVEIGIGIGLVVYGFVTISWLVVCVGLAVMVAYPLIWAHLLVIPLVLGNKFIIGPQRRALFDRAEQLFAHHPGDKIAVTGSYGKTSMKELLVTVLGENLKVAATPGNKNVLTAHAAFARRLQGDEDVVIIEYGEGAPGDVANFARLTHPTHAVITGLAPAHLDQYKTVLATGQDIFSVTEFVAHDKVYVNGESPLAESFMQPTFATYTRDGALGWLVSDIRVHLTGTAFTLKKDAQKLHLQSGLLGRHAIGPLAFTAAFALNRGVDPKTVEMAIAKTRPYEHRMQPYQLAGAWIIDDTYNGNIEGIRAGTALLAELDAKRKLYVTPGLVDQGDETPAIHREIGRLIAAAKPDIVVLMQNSVTQYIQEGLADSAYDGEIRSETEPLAFYTNLQHIVAAGDVVLMQNDWTDNYH